MPFAGIFLASTLIAIRVYVISTCNLTSSVVLTSF
jgi:hypothetical protein